MNAAVRFPRLGLVGLLALGLAALLILDAGAVGAQQAPLLAARFYGTLTFAGQPAPSGTQIQAITARNANDFVVCGSGRVFDTKGDYVLKVPVNRTTGIGAGLQNATERCLAASASLGSGTLYVMVARGENVGTCTGSAVLDDATTWGQTNFCPLAGTLPASAPLPTQATAASPLSTPGAFPTPAVRFFGTLTLSGQPALRGTAIQAMATRGTSGRVQCGTGSVFDDRGDYVLAVPVTAPAGCAAANSAQGSGTIYTVLVNGENVGTCGGSAVLNDATTLGHVEFCPLAGALPAGGS